MSGSENPDDALAAIRRHLAAPETRLSDDEIELLIRSLGAERKELRRRAADAIGAVAVHDSRVIAASKAALGAADSRTRFGAAFALGLCGDGAFSIDAVDALCDALSDSDGDVRWAAAELIKRLAVQSRDEIRARLIAITRAGDGPARRMAIYCLRDLEIRDPETLAVIDNASRASDSHLRLAAISALARFKADPKPAAQIALHCLHDDPSPGVRRACAAALGQLGWNDASVIEALRAASVGADASLAGAAGNALATLEHPDHPNHKERC